jgi:photosystem II stability/assembly factor-like uncharacterized protein
MKTKSVRSGISHLCAFWLPILIFSLVNGLNPLLAADLPAPAPRLDQWKILGPGGGGTMIAPTVSPHNPAWVVEHCDMTGGYITKDSGQSWRMFNLRAGISTFAFDPLQASVIYAGNAALWRSQDSGQTWHMLFPSPKKKFEEHMCGDHADYFLTTEDPSYPYSGQEVQIEAIAVDPADSRRIYLAFGGSPARTTSSRIFFTSDGGEHWLPLHDLPSGHIFVLYAKAGPRGKGTELTVVSEKGVFHKSGDQWESKPGPAGRSILFASAGSSRDGQTIQIYASTSTDWKGNELSGGVFISEDFGTNWTNLTPAILEGISQPGSGRPPGFRAISCALYDSSASYIGFQGLRLGAGPEGLFNGIARTTDSGKHWTLVHQESNRPSSNLSGSWIEGWAVNGNPNIWFDTPYSLGAAPRDPNVCFATDLFRTYFTRDGGKNWQQVNSVNKGDNRWTTRGLDVTTCYGVHFDPFDLKHLFITYTDIGLFQSRDGGQSWTGSTEGIPNRWRNTTYWVEMDPQVKDLMWGAFAMNHDLPRPKMWRRNSPSRFQGGVAISRDGGQHWILSNEGMAETAVTHILMDPRSPSGMRTLYACGFGRGVYKSTDNGKTWALKNAGLLQTEPFAWRLTLAGDGTLYLVVARRSDGGRIGDANDGALYKSVNGAENWEPMGLPAGTNGPMGLAVDPSNLKNLYLSAWGVQGERQDIGGGVFLSLDGGKTWKPLFAASQHVYDLTIDPVDPKVLYLCGFDSAAYRSPDQGKNWERLRGFNFKWGHRVIPDPVDKSKVYITTYGGSVWHGPAKGDPTAREDAILRE